MKCPRVVTRDPANEGLYCRSATHHDSNAPSPLFLLALQRKADDTALAAPAPLKPPKRARTAYLVFCDRCATPPSLPPPSSRNLRPHVRGCTQLAFQRFFCRFRKVRRRYHLLWVNKRQHTLCEPRLRSAEILGSRRAAQTAPLALPSTTQTSIPFHTSPHPSHSPLHSPSMPHLMHPSTSPFHIPPHRHTPLHTPHTSTHPLTCPPPPTPTAAAAAGTGRRS